MLLLIQVAYFNVKAVLPHHTWLVRSRGLASLLATAGRGSSSSSRGGGDSRRRSRSRTLPSEVLPAVDDTCRGLWKQAVWEKQRETLAQQLLHLLPESIPFTCMFLSLSVHMLLHACMHCFTYLIPISLSSNHACNDACRPS